MPLFKYISTSLDGRTHKGFLNADSVQQVRSRLHEQGLFPTDIILIEKRPSSANALFLNLFKKRTSSATLALLTFQLGTLLSAGMSIEASLESISEQLELPFLNSILLRVRALVLEGYTLAASMDEFPSVFPSLYRSTIAAGEQAGNLNGVVNKLADYLEHQEAIRQKLTQALIYPALLTTVSLLIIGFLLAYTMPKITAIFTDTGQALPEVTVILLALSNHLKTFGMYYFIILVFSSFGFKKLLKYPAFQLQVDLLLIKLPLINTSLITINSARFSRTFGILFAATVPVLEAMRTASKTISLIPMRVAVEKAIIQIGEGLSIHQALLQTGFFSKLTTQLIASGEASGKLELMLEKTANYQDKNTIRKIDMALSLFEPLTILIMGIVVLFIVLATLLPIFQMNEFVS